MQLINTRFLFSAEIPPAGIQIMAYTPASTSLMSGYGVSVPGTFYPGLDRAPQLVANLLVMSLNWIKARRRSRLLDLKFFSAGLCWPPGSDRPRAVSHKREYARCRLQVLLVLLDCEARSGMKTTAVTKITHITGVLLLLI